MNIKFEEVTLKKETYDSLMSKAAFFDAYVAGKIKFADGSEKEALTLWTKENAFIEIEDYYKTLFEDYKNRVRKRFTIKFWRWTIKISRK